MAKHRNPTANSETDIERNHTPEKYLWISPLYIRERILQSLLEREAHIVNKIRTIRENVAECLSRKNVYNLAQVRLSQMNGKNER